MITCVELYIVRDSFVFQWPWSNFKITSVSELWNWHKHTLPHSDNMLKVSKVHVYIIYKVTFIVFLFLYCFWPIEVGFFLWWFTGGLDAKLIGNWCPYLFRLSLMIYELVIYATWMQTSFQCDWFGYFFIIDVFQFAVSFILWAAWNYWWIATKKPTTV